MRLTGIASAAALVIGSWGCGRVGDEEAKEFRESLPVSRVAVYPTVVRGPQGAVHDVASAAALARGLGEAGAKDVVVLQEKLQLSRKASFNQAAMFKSSLESFGEQVRAKPPQAEYAVVVELLTSTDGAVGGIHLYVVRPDGSRAFGCLLNSHYREFKRVWPKSSGEATGVLLTWLKEDFPRE
jgi:hypothetical protein